MSLVLIVRVTIATTVAEKGHRRRAAGCQARTLEHAPAGLHPAAEADRSLPNGAVGPRGRDPWIQMHLPSTPVVFKEFPRRHHISLERVTFMIRLVNLRREVTDSETTCVTQEIPLFPVFRMSPLVVGALLHLWATSQAVGSLLRLATSGRVGTLPPPESESDTTEEEPLLIQLIFQTELIMRCSTKMSQTLN